MYKTANKTCPWNFGCFIARNFPFCSNVKLICELFSLRTLFVSTTTFFGELFSFSVDLLLGYGNKSQQLRRICRAPWHYGQNIPNFQIFSDFLPSPSLPRPAHHRKSKIIKPTRTTKHANMHDAQNTERLGLGWHEMRHVQGRTAQPQGAHTLTCTHTRARTNSRTSALSQTHSTRTLAIN